MEEKQETPVEKKEEEIVQREPEFPEEEKDTCLICGELQDDCTCEEEEE